MIRDLLSKLYYKAYASPNLHAEGEQELGASKKLYDITQIDYKIFVQSKRSGRAAGWGCTVRYELYPLLA